MKMSCSPEQVTQSKAICTFTILKCPKMLAWLTSQPLLVPVTSHFPFLEMQGHLIFWQHMGKIRNSSSLSYVVGKGLLLFLTCLKIAIENEPVDCCVYSSLASRFVDTCNTILCKTILLGVWGVEICARTF